MAPAVPVRTKNNNRKISLQEYQICLHFVVNLIHSVSYKCIFMLLASKYLIMPHRGLVIMMFRRNLLWDIKGDKATLLSFSVALFFVLVFVLK